MNITSKRNNLSWTTFDIIKALNKMYYHILTTFFFLNKDTGRIFVWISWVMNTLCITLTLTQVHSYISMTSGTRKWHLFCHYRALLHTRKSSKSHYPPFVKESSESEWGGQRILTPHLTRMSWWKDTLSSRVRTCDKDSWMDVQNQWPTAHPGERNIFILDVGLVYQLFLLNI